MPLAKKRANSAGKDGPEIGVEKVADGYLVFEGWLTERRRILCSRLTEQEADRAAKEFIDAWLYERGLAVAEHPKRPGGILVRADDDE